MKTKLYLTHLLSLIVLLSLSACGDSINGADDVIFPEADVSYKYHVQPYLAYTCSYSACHGITPGFGAQQAYSYTSLVINATGWVNPGNADGSLLVQILENPTQHPNYMLYYIPEIEPEQALGVRTWIEEGADNN